MSKLVLTSPILMHFLHDQMRTHCHIQEKLEDKILPSADQHQLLGPGNMLVIISFYINCVAFQVDTSSITYNI